MKKDYCPQITQIDTDYPEVKEVHSSRLRARVAADRFSLRALHSRKEKSAICVNLCDLWASLYFLCLLLPLSLHLLPDTGWL